MPDPALYRETFAAMGSPCEVQLCPPDPAQAPALAHAVIAEVRRIEYKYSRYRDDSVTQAINRHAGQGPCAIDAETAALLAYGETCFQQSGGRFDLSSGILRRAWAFRTAPGEPPRLPSQHDLDALLPLIGWQKVQLTPTHITLPLAGMEIDFGGIGKEYAVDRAADLCLAAGCRSGLINLGGDIRLLGPQPDGQAWAIGIVDPARPGQALATLWTDNGAVATSGDYERAIVVNGQRYGHILDARNGWPTGQLQSATAHAPRCLVAGSLVTLAMLLPEADALALLAANSPQWLAIGRDGRLHSSASTPAQTPVARHHPPKI